MCWILSYILASVKTTGFRNQQETPSLMVRYIKINKCYYWSRMHFWHNRFLNNGNLFHVISLNIHYCLLRLNRQSCWFLESWYVLLCNRILCPSTPGLYTWVNSFRSVNNFKSVSKCVMSTWCYNRERVEHVAVRDNGSHHLSNEDNVCGCALLPTREKTDVNFHKRTTYLALMIAWQLLTFYKDFFANHDRRWLFGGVLSCVCQWWRDHVVALWHVHLPLEKEWYSKNFIILFCFI